ncbi:MAG TPA: fused MFS/spermidine synthase, partial [Bryobacteraceae bacterium]|nr:fused MFS/spermidine synthase [Bryobacteraceae bacterium]
MAPQRKGVGRAQFALAAVNCITARDIGGFSRGDCAKMNRFMGDLFPNRAQRHDQPVGFSVLNRAQRHDQPVRLAVLLALFAGSGCAALIYEVVWFQLLQLVIGSSAVSLGVLLGTYMGGMCLGSFLLPRVVSARYHPFRVYAAIELGIGACGILVLFGVPRLDRLYPAIAVPGFAGILLLGVISAMCLLPPTLLMGASLPAMARWIRSSPAGVSWLGFFYGGNIAGAVLGSILAGFYLLRLFDMAVATYVAVAINVIVALIGMALAFIAPYEREPEAEEHATATRPAGAWAIYLVIGLSGLCALGAEVVWTRLLSLMLGATVYTFSIILAVFLTGLGLGSSAGSVLARRIDDPRGMLGVCQFLLAGAAAWAAYTISVLIPSRSFDPTIPVNPLPVFRMDLLRAAWAILPAACLWGASFPLALAALARVRKDEDSGALVGETYAANTVGAIAGAVGFSMILIPSLGTQAAERWLIALPVLAALIALAGRVKMVALAAAIVVAVLLARSVRPVPWLAIAYGRRMNQFIETAGKPLYIGEGMNASIVVSELTTGARYFHVSGKVEATTEPFDMRLQRMLGHISALFAARPESVLVVGFGAGVTAGTFTLHPETKRIVICELERLIPPATTQYFKRENYDVLHDPRARVFYDDARHFVLTTKEKFDVITSDPIHPWVKGTATLYSKEYFEMCKRHLKPGGVVTQWVPLYESDPETIKSELATFFEVFPHATIWNSDASNRGYDVVLLGQAEPGPIDMDALEQKLRRPEYARVVASLDEVGLGSALDLLSTYA